MGGALGWALLIGATERAWRGCLPSRARAWQLTALTLLACAAWVPPAASRRSTPRGSSTSRLLLGAAVAGAGYPLGRALAGDRATAALRDTLPADLAGLTLMALAEELTWRARVEPVLGILPTALLFAVKHPLIDRRWRRTLGLALFWIGLGLFRPSSDRAALCLHVAANAGGVVLGHARGRDEF